MRKWEKQAALEICDSLIEAHRQAEKYAKEDNDASCYAVLSACQESAVSLGNKIEKTEGEGTDAVSVLEKYCETIYQLGQRIGEVDKEQLRHGFAELNDLVTAVRSHITEDIRLRYEVIFMPYKASMWDSLESVYLAFQKQSDVDVYLIPMPYYYRDETGHMAVKNYEGDLFPENEPVTDCEKYDFEGRRPDIIFVHNPYDSYNFVTSVDPRFYSYELKKYTDCLVYVPYFATSGSMGEEKGQLMSCLSFDYIVAQSQEMKDVYNERFRDKVIVEGSPKYDKVIDLCHEKEENPDAFWKKVPADWKDTVEGKRVYFFNTSIGGMLHDTEHFVKKLKYVFETFANQDGVVLLWRPHPLLENSFKSMRPEFYDEYIKQKQFFIDHSIGILDETPDMDKSIAVSDCYIGDSGSSVVNSFRVTGKMIYILDDAILNKCSKLYLNKLLLMLIPYNEESGGYVLSCDNRLFYGDFLDNGDVKFKYINRVSDQLAPFDECLYYKGKVCMWSYNYPMVKAFERDKRSVYIGITKYKGEFGELFSQAYVDNGYLILIPHNCSEIVRVNLDNYKVQYIPLVIDEKSDESAGKNFYHSRISYNGHWFIGGLKDNSVFVVDSSSNSLRRISVGDESCKGAIFVKAKKKGLWILPVYGYKVRFWDPDTNECRIYDVSIDGINCFNPHIENNNDNNDEPFSSAIEYDGFLYIAPRFANCFVKLNIYTGKAERWMVPINTKWPEKDSMLFPLTWLQSILYEKDNKYYCVNYTTRELFKIDSFESPVFKKVSVSFPVEQIADDMNMYRPYAPWSGYAMHESAFSPLSDFISAGADENGFDSQRMIEENKDIAVNLDGTAGQHICDFFMDKLSRENVK